MPFVPKNPNRIKNHKATGKPTGRPPRLAANIKPSTIPRVDFHGGTAHILPGRRIEKTLALRPPSSLTKDEKIQALAEALANPGDVRSPEELAMDLTISPFQVKQLMNTPQFMDPIVLQFHRNLTYTKISIMKMVLRQVTAGNLRAARLALQSLGAVPTTSGVTINNTTINATLGLTEGSLGTPTLTDEELDREIHRLMMDTHPDDVRYDCGDVVPVDFVEVKDDSSTVDTGPRFGRTDLSREAGEAEEAVVGKTEEDG